MTNNATTNRYGSIAAEIYDLDKPVGLLPDTKFYLERLTGLSGRILEPACGSGRALLPLLAAGLDATGFDPSPEMLERCRARCTDAGFSPPLSSQRFEDFDYDQPFDAIVIPVASFTLIDSFDVATAVLRRFCDHLTPGGVLVLDIELTSALAATGGGRRQWTAENGDLLTLEAHRSRTDWFTQQAEGWLRYERWRDNRLVESQLEIMVQRYWGLEEFRMALQLTGFGAISVAGNYDRTRPVRARDHTVTFEATRL